MIFYRAVSNLVDFSLVTKLTKHVSKVRETVRKCEKIRQNDCNTFFMTSDSQKMTSRFLDSYFCTKFRISQPGWYPDRAIKIRHFEKITFLRTFRSPNFRLRALFGVFRTVGGSYKKRQGGNSITKIGAMCWWAFFGVPRMISENVCGGARRNFTGTFFCRSKN